MDLTDGGRLDLILDELTSQGDTNEGKLDIAQADLDNPNQYKADVSALAIESNVEGHVTDALNSYDPPTRIEATNDKNEIITQINANETKIDSIITTLSTLIADIWSYATRTLTSFGTLISDIWNAGTRTLTGIGSSGIASESNATSNKNEIISEIDDNEAKIDIIDLNVDSIKSDIESGTYGLLALKTLIDDIDTSAELEARFNEIKGTGWTTETLKAIKDAIDAIVDNTDWTSAEKKQIRDALGIDGLKVTAQSGQLQRALGLMHENFRIFNPVYNTDHFLTSATIKVYPTATDCNNDTNAIASYSVIATYNTYNEMETYKVVKN